MRLTSSSFEPGAAIPALFTCEGKDVSPEFDWTDTPRETKSFVLILHDPDAPMANGFTHWVLYNIPASVNHIEANRPRAAKIAGLGIQGKNDAGKIGYVGPCPPSGTHRYFVRLYALRSELALAPRATREEVEEAMQGRVIEEAELMGTYTRSQTRAEPLGDGSPQNWRSN
jgi:Raf kinase inhibitor-like YbhB/YbcL family protein